MNNTTDHTIDTASDSNPWADGHSIETLRRVADGIVASASGYSAEAIDCDGVPGERILDVDSGDTDRSILYFHGGAYLCGNPQQYRNITASLARAASAEVIAVDYRLAPEHGHPAAFDDAWRAYRWLSRHRVDNTLVCRRRLGGRGNRHRHRTQGG